MKKRGKKAQQIFGMQFSTIFSVLLIAFLIAVAFFAIKHFLEIKNCSQIALFVEDLNTEIENAWKSATSEKVFSGDLPSGIQYVCFADLSKDANTEDTEEEKIYNELRRNADYTANLFFYPRKKDCIASSNIEHISTEELTNPYCFKVVDGKIRITIEKGFYDSLVKISR